jgi:F-type H+-transporting ATPase subunit a
MGLEFLARVRRTSIGLGALAALLAATYRGPAAGIAVLLGGAWCLVNLFLLEKLVVALTGAERGTLPSTRRAAWSIGGMGALFAAGALMLVMLPAIWLLAGFWIPFGVIVLKAATLLLLPTNLWRRLTGGRFGAAIAVVVFVLGAWLAAGGWTATGAPRKGAESAPKVVALADHGAAEPHGATGGDPAGDAHGDPAGDAHGGPAGAAGDAASGHGASSGPEKFPNVITVLTRANPDAPWSHFLHRYEAVFFSLFIAVLLCIVAFLATRNPQLIPRPLQNTVEFLVEGLYGFVVGILGPRYGPRYVPFLGTLFIYILFMNLFGLIPFMDSPTSSLNVTFALAIVVFLYSQYIGIRELGVVRYVDHLMGSPRDLIGWLLVPLMLPIHVMGELAKPISLSCRLFGNIFGEDMLLVAFATLGVTMLSFTHLPIGVPLQLPFIFLALLTSTLQALVFTVLSTIYFLLMLPHDDHEHEHEAQPAH